MYENGSKLVYISGPYTLPDPVVNVHETIQLATQFLDTGIIVPLVPHLTMFWHLVTPRDYEIWLEYDCELVKRADAVYRRYGESSGADIECELAVRHKIPLFGDYDRLMEWAYNGD